jgi:hypothetical protein
MEMQGEESGGDPGLPFASERFTSERFTSERFTSERFTSERFTTSLQSVVSD